MRNSNLVAALVAGTCLAACAGRQPPERLRALEITHVDAPPDAVFRAARDYYARNKYQEIALDTDARLASLVSTTNGFQGTVSNREVVWVRPAQDGGSELRIKATWGPGLPNSDRPAAVAAAVREDLRHPGATKETAR